MNSLLTGFQNQSVTYRPYQGAAAYGGPVYGGEQELRCRVENSRRWVPDSTGELVPSEAVIYITLAIHPQDQFLLGGRWRPVLQVTEAVGLDGRTDHWEVRV